MSAELETIGAASGSSALIAIAVVIIKDWLKSRNGNSGATKADIVTLSTKISVDVKGIYDKLDEWRKDCGDRHHPIDRELADHSARLKNLEKDNG